MVVRSREMAVALTMVLTALECHELHRETESVRFFYISRLKCCPSCCENGWRWSIVIKGQKNMIRNCRRYNLQCTVIQANKKPWNIFQCSTVSDLGMNPGSDRTIWMSFLPSEGPFFHFISVTLDHRLLSDSALVAFAPNLLTYPQIITLPSRPLTAYDNEKLGSEYHLVGLKTTKMSGVVRSWRYMII